MARKTIFDIFNELNENEEIETEQLATNEVPQNEIEVIEEIEETKIEKPKEQPHVDLETVNNNNTLQSIIKEGSEEDGV